jgi:peptidoglycan/LPS O-acetylase OafA/YrhL
MGSAARYLEAHVPGGGGWENWRTLTAQALFLQNFRTLTYASVIGGTWFVATWSLAVEEQFYLVAPIAIRFLTVHRLCYCLGIAILSAPILRMYLHSTDHANLAYTLMPCRADALAIGVLTALLWRDNAFRVWLSSRESMLLITVTVFFAGVGALCKWAPYHDSFVEQSAGYTWIAIFYALVVLLALSKPSGWLACLARTAWLRELGKVSYCMYLIQMAIGMFCQALLIGVLGRVASWQLIAVNCGTVVLTYVIARLSWAYFENPLLQKSHKYMY